MHIDEILDIQTEYAYWGTAAIVIMGIYIISCQSVLYLFIVVGRITPYALLVVTNVIIWVYESIHRTITTLWSNSWISCIRLRLYIICWDSMCYLPCSMYHAWNICNWTWVRRNPEIRVGGHSGTCCRRVAIAPLRRWTYLFRIWIYTLNFALET